MFAQSISVDVNPFGTSPILNKEQLWRGIESKAEEPVIFVPGMESSQVIERTEDGKVCVPYDVIHADFDLRAVA